MSLALSNASLAIQAGADVTIDHTDISGGSADGVVSSGPGPISLLMTQSSVDVTGAAFNIATGSKTLTLQSCTITGGAVSGVQGSGCTLTMADCSMTGGVSVALGAALTISNSQLYATSGPVIQLSSSSLALTDVGLTKPDCDSYALIDYSNAVIDFRRVTVNSGLFGVALGDASGTVRDLTVTGSPCGLGTGLIVGRGIVFPVDDSTSVAPSAIRNFSQGIVLSGIGPFRLRNILISGAQNALLAGNQKVELSYCTIASSVTGMSSPGPGSAIYNSIINAPNPFLYATGPCLAVAYSDLWPVPESSPFLVGILRGSIV